MKKIISSFSLIFLLISLISCSSYKIEQGMKYFNHVPSMNLGIQTNVTQYDINNVELDIYYGWEESFFNSREGYENIAAVIYAHDAALSSEKSLEYELNDFKDLKDINHEVYNITTSSYNNANYHIIKTITEDLNNEKYIVKLSKTGKALYKTHEKILIPKEVFVNPKVGFNIAISLVVKNLNTGKYQYLYENSISLDFKIVS
jgi:hypothetical protein